MCWLSMTCVHFGQSQFCTETLINALSIAVSCRHCWSKLVYQVGGFIRLYIGARTILSWIWKGSIQIQIDSRSLKTQNLAISRGRLGNVPSLKRTCRAILSRLGALCIAIPQCCEFKTFECRELSTQCRNKFLDYCVWPCVKKTCTVTWKYKPINLPFNLSTNLAIRLVLSECWFPQCNKILSFKPPGPNEDESCWEFKLSLSFGLKLSESLMRSYRILTCSNSEAHLAQGDDSRWEMKKTIMRVHSHSRLARAL